MQFTKTILANGLRLITIPMNDNPSVTVLVMVETGSEYETKEINGISHFLEHMVFKGTPRRPKATDISRELDGLGANYNAFTGQEYTGYYAKVSATHVDRALDIIADLYLNPLLNEEDMEKEKGVIIEELRMYQDMPQRDVQDLFTSLLFGDQPAGWNVAGTEERVRSYTREQLVAYRRAHYVTAATTVVIAGSFDGARIEAEVSQSFGGMSASPKIGKTPVRDVQEAPAIALKYKETDQTHLVIGFRTFPLLDERLPTVQVLSTILGGGMSSRLWERLRDQLGMCYYIRSSHNPNTDHGDLTVSAGVDNGRVPEAVKEVLGQIKKLKDELVSDAELKKAQDYISGTTLLELETSEARAEYAGFQETLKKKIELPDELLSRIQKVTAADIQALARQIFRDRSLNMAVVGKFKDESVFRTHFTVDR